MENPNGDGACTKCGHVGERRGGICWACANAGELKAFKRTCPQHLLAAARNVLIGRFDYAKFDLRWCVGRLTRTGDYKPGGYFEREHGRL